MPNPDLPQHTAQGIQRHQNTDYKAIEARILAKLKKLPSYDLDWVECMINHLIARTQQPPDDLRIGDLGPSTTITNKPPSGVSGQSETFQSLCEQSKNPIPLKQPMGGVAITNWVDALTFPQLCSAADRYDIPHNESEWLDDDSPDKTDELRAAVAEAMEKVGK